MLSGPVKVFILSTLVFVTAQAFATPDSPWHAIRTQRINQLLPEAMRTAGVAAWMTLCRENNNDPVADHIGGENAGGQAVFLFYLDEQGFHSKVFSPASEATALADLKIHHEVAAIPRGESTLSAAAEFIRERGFQTIAVNSSGTNAQADGLSYTQRKSLETALGPKISERMVPAESLIYEWLSIKLPEEVEIMREAARLTAEWQIQAYKQVVPGRSTDADIAKFLKQKMAEHGVTDGWAPDQNPNVNSGPDRGHSHPTDKVIMPGDVIQIDFGIRVHNRWVSDIQRFAYVLQPGETGAPPHIEQYWQFARAGGEAAFNAMKPGVHGIAVDVAQQKMLREAGSEPVLWSTGHPVGYVAHDTGPNLGGSQSETPRPAALKPLKTGMVFAFDGFHSWKLEGGNLKTISVEEMAVITETGAEYLIPPQRDLILIPNS